MGKGVFLTCFIPIADILIDKREGRGRGGPKTRSAKYEKIKKHLLLLKFYFVSHLFFCLASWVRGVGKVADRTNNNFGATRDVLQGVVCRSRGAVSGGMITVAAAQVRVMSFTVTGGSGTAGFNVMVRTAAQGCTKVRPEHVRDIDAIHLVLQKLVVADVVLAGLLVAVHTVKTQADEGVVRDLAGPVHHTALAAPRIVRLSMAVSNIVLVLVIHIAVTVAALAVVLMVFLKAPLLNFNRRFYVY